MTALPFVEVSNQFLDNILVNPIPEKMKKAAIGMKIFNGKLTLSTRWNYEHLIYNQFKTN